MIQVLTIQTKLRIYLENWVNCFLDFIFHIDITILLVTCIDKFNIVLSFRNLKNNDIVYIFVL